MVERAGIGAGRLQAGRTWGVGTAVGDEPGFGFRRRDCSRSGGGAAQGALIGVAEASTGRLDVGAGPLARSVLVERQCVQARQAGSGRQKNQQEEGRLSLGQSREHE